MTQKKFYDWQTAGGTDDVMRLVDRLERADMAWCVIGDLAVNPWATEPIVTQDVNFVVTTESVNKATQLLEEAGFKSERFQWPINLRGRSKASIQLSTEDFYKDFPSRSVPADIHGILMRVASLEDTLNGKIKASLDLGKKQSKKTQGAGRPRPIGGKPSASMGVIGFGFKYDHSTAATTIESKLGKLRSFSIF